MFDLLRERGQMSRAEITRDTGMSFPTAMKVVDAFLEKGLLVELLSLIHISAASYTSSIVQRSSTVGTSRPAASKASLL